MNKKKKLVLGLGNTILTDDGVGIYVAREIAKIVDNTDVVVEEAGIGGLEILEIIAGYQEVTIIDAMTTGQHSPGTLFKVAIEDLKGGAAFDRHHISLKEAVDLGMGLEMDLPDEIVIYGIEIQPVREFGEKCTPDIEKCIPEIVKKIIKENSLASDMIK